MKTRNLEYLILLLLTLLLPACSADGEKPPPEEIPTLVYATIHPENVDHESISRFNKAHENIRIEVRDYSESNGAFSGWDRLLIEMQAGHIPDLIDMSGMQIPYQQLASKGYLEDLWPYIEGDSKLGRAGVFEAPLRAAEVEGKLYMLFSAVRVDTLVGAEDVVGNRYSWTLEELLEAYAAMPEEATILEYFTPREDLLFYMGIMNLDSYVDWKTGECSFDSGEFRTFLEFCNHFSNDFDWDNYDVETVNEELASRQEAGLQMLHHEYIQSWGKIPAIDAAYGGRAAFVGYPTEDGSMGSCFEPVGECLAMTSACRNKEAAWAFMRELILPTLRRDAKTWQIGEAGSMFLVNRADYECAKMSAMLEKNMEDALEYQLFYNGAIFRVTQVTEEQCQRFETFLNSIDKIGLCDNSLFHIVEEICVPYFAGDKSLDDAIALVQSRAKLYVNERR